MGLSGFLPVAIAAGGVWHFRELDSPSLMRPEAHCAATSPLQVCEPSLSGNITAFALKARVVYPINQKFRVSTPSSIFSVAFTPCCAGLHGGPRAWTRCGFPSCLKVCCVTDTNLRASDSVSVIGAGHIKVRSYRSCLIYKDSSCPIAGCDPPPGTDSMGASGPVSVSLHMARVNTRCCTS